MKTNVKKQLTLKEFAQTIVRLAGPLIFGPANSDRVHELADDYLSAWGAFDAEDWFKYIPTLRGKVNELISAAKERNNLREANASYIIRNDVLQKQADALDKSAKDAWNEVISLRLHNSTICKMRDTAANEFYKAQAKIAQLEERLSLYAAPHVLQYPLPPTAQPAAEAEWPTIGRPTFKPIPTSNLGMSAPITAVRCHELIAETLRKERNTLRQQLAEMTAKRDALRAERDKIKKLLEEEYTA